MHDPKVKLEAIRLRVEMHLGLQAIADSLGISKGTASLWLKDHPLSQELVHQRLVANGRSPKRPTPIVTVPRIQGVTTTDKGEAVRLITAGRLMLAGLEPFLPAKESTSTDILVLSEGRALKCQCKLMWQAKSGVHIMNLSSLRNIGVGRRHKTPYTSDEVDFFLGFCTVDDGLYVIPYSVAQPSGNARVELRLWIANQPAGRNQRGIFDAAPYRNAFHLLR